MIKESKEFAKFLTTNDKHKVSQYDVTMQFSSKPFDVIVKELQWKMFFDRF